MAKVSTPGAGRLQGPTRGLHIAWGVLIMVATKPVDLRKGHDGLAALVKNELRKDPFTGTVFVLAYKRLEEHTFTWPDTKDGLMTLSYAQFEALIAGLDWRRSGAQRNRQRETGVRVSTSLLVLHELSMPAMQPVVVCLIVIVEPSPDGPIV